MGNKKLEQTFQRARKFLSSLSDSPSLIPDVGDRDDGYALSKYLRISFERKSNDHEARVITFPESGYTLCNPANEVKVLFDHGALGKPPSYGHGHADALSLIVLLKDKEVICDSGTYGYAVERHWRKYFKSTAAHNTITVDDRNQADYLNGFIWKKPYSAKLIHRQEEKDETILLAKHNGYATLGVTHYRGLVVDYVNGLFIWDHIAGDSNHKLTLRWHVIDQVKLEENDFVVASDIPLKITILDATDVELKQPQSGKIAGWKSFSYGNKSPISLIEANYEGMLPYTFLTFISWGNDSKLRTREFKKYIDHMLKCVDEA